MFAKYGKFDNPGGPKRKFIPEGDHNVTLGKIEHRDSKKSGNEMVIVEFAIGEEDDYVQIYTLKNRYIAQNCAAFFAALAGMDLEKAQETTAIDLANDLEIPVPDGVDANDPCIEMVSSLACSEAQPFNGEKMFVQARQTKTKDNKDFTVTTWSKAD